NQMLGRFTYILLPIALLFQVLIVYGQTAKLTASAPGQVQVGQRFQVTWSLNTKGSNFIAPEISDFQVLGGPNQSTNMQWINGSMTQSISYSYVLRATKEGTFKIGPAKIKVGNGIVKSNELTVRVLKGAATSSGSTKSAAGKSQTKKSSGTSGEDLYARVEVNKRKVDLGEKIIADLKIYSRVSIVNFDDWKMPTFEGFWSKETTTNQQIQLENEVINGVMYQTGLIKRVVLYPQKSGEITIDPMELTVIVRERTSGRSRSMFDQFFGGGYQDYKRPIKSNSVKIKVKPLPSGKPADFSGLTGKFNLKATLDRSETVSNEAINLKVTVSGDGNLYQLRPLKLDFPPDIEVFDPKTSDNIKVASNGISGSRTFEYVLIPRYAGEFEIGPFSFSYFDAANNRYRTVDQEAFLLKVAKGEGEEDVSPAVNIANKEDIRMIGSDIRYIKQGQYPILSGSNYFYRSVGFYAAIAVPILLFLLLIGYVEYQKSQGKDISRLKSKRATGLAKKRLNTAKKLWDENKTTAFYEEVFKALTDYTADKFSIPVANLTKDTIRENLKNKNVPSETVDSFIAVLDRTEFARFAPGADKKMGSIYDEALQAIVNVENHA
ncbi:MAG: BatD family protein, partial [Flavobacteriales bacterium]|nr:BatD family protein [Flavobacteriales bacterium]